MMNIRPEGYRNTADVWETLYQLKERNIPVTAQIGAIDYVEDKIIWVLFFPDYPNITGLVPESETGLPLNLISRFVGMEINVVIKGLDRENKIVACSRKEVVEVATQQLEERLSVGDIIEGTVKAIIRKETTTVLVVDIGGGVLVEIPRSQAAIRRSAPLRAQYNIGERVLVKVISTEPLQVSIRAAIPDPWKQADFKRGQFISGTVYLVKDGNVFIEPDLTPGVLGLAPLPMLGDVQRGYRVSCKVRYFSSEQKKLHLYLVNRLV